MAPPAAPPARLSRPPTQTFPPGPTTTSPSNTPPSASSPLDPDAPASPGAHLPSSFLAPRVAVALNVPGPWHIFLFASRLLSIAPAVAWGWPSALLLLDGVISSFVEGGGWEFAETASALACIWVGYTFLPSSVLLPWLLLEPFGGIWAIEAIGKARSVGGGNNSWTRMGANGSSASRPDISPSSLPTASCRDGTDLPRRWLPRPAKLASHASMEDAD